MDYGSRYMVEKPHHDLSPCELKVHDSTLVIKEYLYGYGCLMPPSTIFQLYNDCKCVWQLEKIIDKLHHVKHVEQTQSLSLPLTLLIMQ